MTSLFGFGIGLLAAGLVRVYLGEKRSDKLPMINAGLASIALLAWVVEGNHRQFILLMAIGMMSAVFINVAPTFLPKLNRVQGAIFAIWMLALGSFVVANLVTR